MFDFSFMFGFDLIVDCGVDCTLLDEIGFVVKGLVFVGCGCWLCVCLLVGGLLVS